MLRSEWCKFDRKKEMKQSVKWCDDDGNENDNSVRVQHNVIIPMFTEGILFRNKIKC